jgi:hypothetical protein
MSFHEGSNWQEQLENSKNKNQHYKNISDKRLKYDELSRFEKIKYWSGKYQFNFQFWDKEENNVYIEKGGIELTSFGGCLSLEQVIDKALEYIEEINNKHF